MAHRVVYETLVGPIPEGMVLDHRCRNTTCVNPDHMRVCTQGDNVRFSQPVTPRCGHVYDSGRKCRTCRSHSRQQRAVLRKMATGALLSEEPVRPGFRRYRRMLVCDGLTLRRSALRRWIARDLVELAHVDDAGVRFWRLRVLAALR